MKLYRLMKSDGGTPPLPVIGDRFGQLGVRPNDGRPVFDIEADAAGLVHPGTDGMSTFDAPNPPKPKLLDWVIESDDLGGGLRVIPSPDTAGRFHIAPARSMTLAEYQYLLGETRDLWEPVT